MTAATRSGRAATPAPNAPTPTPARPYDGASDTTLRRRGYLTFVEAAGLPAGARFDGAAAALVDAHVQLHQAGRYADAELLLVRVRAHGAHLRRMREHAVLAELEVRVFGSTQALVRQVARRRRAQHARAAQRFDGLYGRVYGPERLALLRLRRQVDAGRRP